VREKGVQEHVVVTGYVKDEGELFALFRRMDVFLFLFPEGLTARRSSVIACLQSNRPVIVSAPLLLTEFDHHAGLKTLIEDGSLGFVPAGASISQVADQLLGAAGPATPPATRVDVAAWWQATIDGARSAMGEPTV
jgi:glycosyltransferase involved in cell wall biosynthesis